MLAIKDPDIVDIHNSNRQKLEKKTSQSINGPRARSRMRAQVT